MKIDSSIAFDTMFDCLSSNNSETKMRLEKYVIHRTRFGKQAASRIYPDCHNIIIHDPLLKQCWDNFLNTIDKMGS